MGGFTVNGKTRPKKGIRLVIVDSIKFHFEFDPSSVINRYM